jgi:hypothetical protein
VESPARAGAEGGRTPIRYLPRARTYRAPALRGLQWPILRTMSSVPALKPLFLLADSSLLFWRVGDRPFLECLRTLTGADTSVPPVQAAYLGASNGDEPAFYEIFTAAMEGIGLGRCRHIPARPSAQEREWLAGSQVVLLAGGEPRVGWQSFLAQGVAELLRERYLAGAVLLGVSAGAMQLGQRVWSAPVPAAGELFPVLGLAPLLVGVHEAPEWEGLERAVRLAGAPAQGLGIPHGGGVLVHPDLSMEAVRHPAVVLSWEEQGRLRQTLLRPPAEPYRGEPTRQGPSDVLG